MRVKLISLVSSLFLLVSATFASAQNILLFTFDDSGPNITATVTGYFATSGMNFVRQGTPAPPGIFPAHTSTIFFWGATTSAVVDEYEGGIATGSPEGFTLLFNFIHGPVETPLSEYFQISAFSFDAPFSSVSLAEGETSFNADTLANNVLVLEGTDLEDFFQYSDNFISTTPTTVFSDPNGENIIQFVLAAPEIILGDVNQDSVANFMDIGSFIGVLLGGGYQAEADCNQDDAVNFMDIAAMIEILSEGSTSTGG